MTIPQAIVFYLMLGAMLSTFADIERQRGRGAPSKPAEPVDGFEPVNRGLIDLTNL